MRALITLKHWGLPLLLAVCAAVSVQILALPARAQVAPGAEQAAGQTATLTGTVAQSNGTPVRGAKVTLSGPALFTATSDDKGAFAFANVPYGIYSVSVNSATLGTATRNNVAVSGDLTLTIKYEASAGASNLKTIASVTTRATGVHINVSPASVDSVSPANYAFQGNVNWRQLVNSIPGVAASGGLSGGATTNSTIPDSPFQPIELSINGAFAYETAVTLDGMPLNNYTFSTQPGGGVDLGALPLPLFESADVVRGPGANSPSIIDSIGGSMVLHAPGAARRNSFEMSLSEDGYGGLYSNSKASFRVGKLSGTVVYGFNNSPGPLAPQTNYGLLTAAATINGQAVKAGGTGFAIGAPSPIYGQCSCVINGTLWGVGGFVSTAWDQHDGGIGLNYQISPAITAQAFYAGNQSTAYQAGVLRDSNFAPAAGSGYTGSLAPGPYLPSTFANSYPAATPEGEASNTYEEKLTAYLGRGVFRIAALQSNSWVQQNLTYLPSATYTLYGTAVLCTNPACTTSTTQTYNGVTATVTQNESIFIFRSHANTYDYLASYETELGAHSYLGLSAVKATTAASFFNFQQFISGTTLTTTGSFIPVSTDSTTEYRLHLGHSFSDHLNVDGSYYIATGGYHVLDPTDPTKARFVDVNFPYSTPRAGATWRFNPDIVARVAAGGGFALPSMFTLIGTNGTPSCNTTNNTCTQTVTNLSLQPEKAFGWNVGTDVRLGRNTLVSVDFYRTDLYGQFFTSQTNLGPNQNPGIFFGFPIFANQTQNLGHSRYGGLNLSARYDPPRGVYGNFGLGLTRGYVISVPQSIYNAAGATCNFTTGVGCTNTFIVPGPNFDGKYNATVPYANGALTLGYRLAPKKYIELLANYQGNNNAYYQPAFVELDGHLSYPLSKNFAIIATARNIAATNAAPYESVYPINLNTLAPTVAGPLFPQYGIPYPTRTLLLTTNISL